MTMMHVRFTVPGEPIPQGSMTPVGKGKMIHKPELIAWRKKVLQVAILAARRAQWPLPYDGPAALGCQFYLTKPSNPRFEVPAVKPDLDKLVRAIQDALAPKHGIGLLKEDSRIWRHITPLKDYAQPGQERAEILLIAADKR